MKKNIYEKTIVVLLTIIVCIVLLEIGLRSLGRIPSSMTDGIYEQFGNSYRLKKNIEKSINWPAFSYTVYTNSYGFRDKRTGDRNIGDKPYMVFLGASEVFANGVNYEDSFVGIFAEYAAKKGFEVLNLAIGGQRFIDQQNLLKDYLKNNPHTPDRVFFCVNVLTIPLFDKNYENIIVKNGYLFADKEWKVAYLRMMIGNLSSVYCFFRDNIRKVQSNLMMYESVDKNPIYLQSYAKSNRMHHPDTLIQFENHLKRFEKFCKKNNIIPVYVFSPIIDSFNLDKLLIEIGENPEQYDNSYYTKLMTNYCKKRNIKLINFKPVLKKYHDNGEKLRFDLNAHYNKFANKIAGEYLINEVFIK